MNMHHSGFVAQYSLRAVALRDLIDAWTYLDMGYVALRKALYTTDAYTRVIHKQAARLCFEKSRALRLKQTTVHYV